MKRFTFTCFLAAFFTLCLGGVQAQDKITKEDYKRAVSFRYQNFSQKVYNMNIRPHWFPDKKGLWFVKRSDAGKKYLKINFSDLRQSELFDHQKLAKLLSGKLGISVEANRLPIWITKYKSPKEIHLRAKNKTYVLNTETYTLTSLKAKASPRRNPLESRSPDKKWTAYSKDYNLYIKSNSSKEIKQLSTEGKKGYEYATWYGWGDIMIGENGERPQRFGVEWAKNSEWIAANIVDFRTARKMYLLDWSVDTLYRPRLLSYYRGSPGDTTMIYTTPVFFNVKSGKEIKVNLPKSTHINAIDVVWSKTPGKVYLDRLSRGYQHYALYTFDLNTEKLETLYTESSATNIDNFSYDLAENSNRLFFLSEKSGWRQLYSLDLKTKKVTPLTKGNYYIHEIERIDEKKRKIFFLASGKESGRNPYYQHLYSISFNGKNLKLLTPENRHHRISFAPNGEYLLDNYATVNQPTQTVLRKASNGKVVNKLAQAEGSRLKNWAPPEILTALARDGKTTIYGAMWKPSNFDPKKRYPVIEYSYTGPHTQVFPKDFRQSVRFQPLAELGFIVVVVDGLGSSGRSKQFHNYSYKNLGGNLEDHVRAIKQWGRKYPWLDTTRVGIFGHSAGGYDAGHAVLAYPDFYKVAVASSADHDHRMEKAWWPEMYMGWPVDSAYHLQSNITMAGNLKGKLLITHGGIDENVNPSATFKLAEALIKADKQFDMLILPSQRHGYRGKYGNYFTKRKWNYFVEHLRGVKPIWDFEWE